MKDGAARTRPFLHYGGVGYGVRCPSQVPPLSSLFVPSGHVVLYHTTLLKVSPDRLAPVRSAPDRLASVRSATFHSLRHTALTMMAESGVPMAVLQRIAGHSNTQITAQYYLHVSPETHSETIRALEAQDNLNTSSITSASKMRVPIEEVSEDSVSA